MNRIKETFREDAKFAALLISILVAGVSYGLYKGALDNYLAETMYKAGAVIMLAGMGMHAVLPPDKVLMTLAICVYSLGEHIQLGMKSTLTMSYARPGRGGAALGVQSSASQIGTLTGYLAVVLVFSLVTQRISAKTIKNEKSGGSCQAQLPLYFRGRDYSKITDLSMGLPCPS